MPSIFLWLKIKGMKIDSKKRQQKSVRIIFNSNLFLPQNKRRSKFVSSFCFSLGATKVHKVASLHSSFVELKLSVCVESTGLHTLAFHFKGLQAFIQLNIISAKLGGIRQKNIGRAITK